METKKSMQEFTKSLIASKALMDKMWATDYDFGIELDDMLKPTWATAFPTTVKSKAKVITSYQLPIWAL